MLIKIRKAQSTAEYAILFAIVIAAALGVQNRVRKALQARIYDATVDFVRETDGRTLQWESTESTKTTTNNIGLKLGINAGAQYLSPAIKTNASTIAIRLVIVKQELIISCVFAPEFALYRTREYSNPRVVSIPKSPIAAIVAEAKPTSSVS